jgi:hypothetical protein
MSPYRRAARRKDVVQCGIGFDFRFASPLSNSCSAQSDAIIASRSTYKAFPAEPCYTEACSQPSNFHNHRHSYSHSTIGFLEPRPSTLTTELLGLTSPAVSDQQCSVVLYQRLLQLVLGVLVDEFLVVSHDALCDRLADGVDLRCVATARDAHADVDDRKLVEADDEDRFVDLFVELLAR